MGLMMSQPNVRRRTFWSFLPTTISVAFSVATLCLSEFRAGVDSVAGDYAWLVLPGLLGLAALSCAAIVYGVNRFLESRELERLFVDQEKAERKQREDQERAERKQREEQDRIERKQREEEAIRTSRTERLQREFEMSMRTLRHLFEELEESAGLLRVELMDEESFSKTAMKNLREMVRMIGEQIATVQDCILAIEARWGESLGIDVARCVELMDTVREHHHLELVSPLHLGNLEGKYQVASALFGVACIELLASRVRTHLPQQGNAAA